VASRGQRGKAVRSKRIYMIDVLRAFRQSGAMLRLGAKAFQFLSYLVDKEDQAWQTPYHEGTRPGVAATDIQICEAHGWPAGKKAWDSCHHTREMLIQECWIERFIAGHRGAPSLYWTQIPPAIAPLFSGGNPGGNEGVNGGDLYTCTLTSTSPAVVDDFEKQTTGATSWRASDEVTASLAHYATSLRPAILELTELFLTYSPGHHRPNDTIAKLASTFGTAIESQPGLIEATRQYLTSSPDTVEEEVRTGKRPDRNAHPSDFLKTLRQQLPRPVMKPAFPFKPASQAHYVSRSLPTHEACTPE
jgi:hypothetical protein